MHHDHKQTSLIWFWFVLFATIGCMTCIWISSQGLSGEADALIFPNSPEKLSILNKHLTSIQEKHGPLMLLLFTSIIVLKYTLSLPGSALLSILAGRLFGFVNGLIISCSMTTVGCLFCYVLTDHLGRSLIGKIFPDKIQQMSGYVEKNKENLLMYLISIRIIPIIPNWFLNISAPLVGVNPITFGTSVLVGMAPFNFVFCNMGSLLTNFDNISDKLLDINTIARLTLLGLSVFIFTRFKSYLSTKKAQSVATSASLSSTTGSFDEQLHENVENGVSDLPASELSADTKKIK
eukprot:TRINITY_DN1799_c0_g1_i3.p1 TRINITY_DN1799_c0_g1~~TRINITY_DN1799_c0_g1_i3.p1  ORF type:complete len:292 (-),score=28.39 TRINITY_DN1799_c0_g1_i3:163-1038(-)